MAEREWREATDLRPARLWLLAVLALAAGLRVWAIGAGLAGPVRDREATLVAQTLRMMTTGELDPRDFTTPSLLIYLQLPVACVRFMAGAVLGWWGGLADAPLPDFLRWARLVVVLFGLGTVLLAHQIGMRWGARHALLAAALVGVTPMSVRGAHAAVTAVPLTFFVALAFLLALQAHERGTARAFAWAGAASGLAMATNYPGAISLALPVVAAWMTFPARPSRLVCVLAAVGGWVGAFLVAVPYAVLDLPAFLDGFARAVGPRGPSPDVRGWLGYLAVLRNDLQWPALLLVLSGMALGIVRAIKGPGRVRWTLLVVFPLLFLWRAAGRPDADGLGLLPAMPFACILAAIAVVSGVSLLRRFSIPRAPRTALIVGLTVAAILPPLVSSIRLVREIGRAAAPPVASRPPGQPDVGPPAQARHPI